MWISNLLCIPLHVGIYIANVIKYQTVSTALKLDITTIIKQFILNDSWSKNSKCFICKWIPLTDYKFILGYSFFRILYLIKKIYIHIVYINMYIYNNLAKFLQTLMRRILTCTFISRHVSQSSYIFCN
jgi:hypothetical protein